MDFLGALFASAEDFVAIVADLGAEGFEVFADVVGFVGGGKTVAEGDFAALGVVPEEFGGGE